MKFNFIMFHIFRGLYNFGGFIKNPLMLWLKFVELTLIGNKINLNLHLLIEWVIFLIFHTVYAMIKVRYKN